MMIVFKFGWAKPVPVDMRNFRHPKRDMALTALAGPVSNFLLAAIVLFIYGGLYPFLYSYGVGQTVLSMLYTTAYLSIALGIFNFIPIPPLDGSKVLFSLLSDEAYYKLMRYERYGMLVLIILVVIVNRLGNPLGTAASAVMDWFFNIAQLSFHIVSRFV
jgi:Zn-dependent protease